MQEEYPGPVIAEVKQTISNAGDADVGDDTDDVDGTDERGHVMPVYCAPCQTWLNGERQWKDHKIGKKHKKNKRKAGRGHASGSGSPLQPEQPELELEVPAKKTEAWKWLEEGRLSKIDQKVAQKSVAKIVEKVAENEAQELLVKEENLSRSARRRRAKKVKEQTIPGNAAQHVHE